MSSRRLHLDGEASSTGRAGLFQFGNDPLGRIMAEREFEKAMYEPLRDLSQESSFRIPVWVAFQAKVIL